MSKRFLKTIAVASTISLILLGGTGKLNAMLDELPENAVTHLVRQHHILHSPGYTCPELPLLGYTLQHFKSIKEDCEKCSMCVLLVKEKKTEIENQNRIVVLEDTVKDTSGSTVMLEKMNEEIQWLKNEFRSIQQLVPSLFPRDQEEQIKIPGVVPELKNLEEKTKTPAIFHAHLNAAEDKGRKEEKREIAKKLIVEQMSDEMVLKITGITVDDLGELKSEKIFIKEEERNLALSQLREKEEKTRKNEKKNNINTWINTNIIEVDNVWNYINSINHGSSHKLNTRLALKQYILNYGVNIGNHVTPIDMQPNILGFPGKMEAIKQLMSKYLTLTGTLHPRWIDFNE